MPTLIELQQHYKEFSEARDWTQFHNPKNIVMALNGEVGELNELFMWLTAEQSASIMEDPKKAHDVKEEIADCMLYLSLLADKLGIDLIQVAEDKLHKAEVKYPVELSKGNAVKYNKR